MSGLGRCQATRVDKGIGQLCQLDAHGVQMRHLWGPMQCGALKDEGGGAVWECMLPSHEGGDHSWRPIPAEPAQPDMVEHPPHYTVHPSGIECITVVEHLSFLRGNAMKYLWRAGSKGDQGQEIEDLRKAVWYIQREIKNLEARQP